MSKLDFQQFHKRQLPHYQHTGHTYLITTCVKRRMNSSDLVIAPCRLTDEALAGRIRNLLIHFDSILYDLHAFVIMPDHLHLLITPSIRDENAISLSRIMHSVKRLTARRINRYRGTHGSVWQDEYHDRQIRNREDYENTLRYMYLNPVSKGLTEDPAGWEWWYYKGA